MHKRISSQICDVTHLFKAKLNNYKLAKLNIFTSLVWWSLLWMESIHWDKVKTDLSNNSDLSWNFQDATKFFWFFLGGCFLFFFSYFFYLIMLLQISSPCYMSSWSWSSQVCDNFIWLDCFVDRLLYSKLLIFIQEQIRLFLFREESDALEAIYMRGYKFQIQKNSVLNCLFKHPFVQTSKAKV